MLIFNISIKISVKVIDILIHELTHAMTNTQFPNAKQSHGKEFKMVSKGIQMDGNKKFKYACANPDLIKKIESWIGEKLDERLKVWLMARLQQEKW